MRFIPTQAAALSVSAVVTFGAVTSAFADDTEIFFGQQTAVAAPNIMFIMDTSGSMGTQVSSSAPYDPQQSYSGTGSCSGASNRIYYTTGNNQGTPPGCNGNYFDVSYLKCAAALPAMNSGGSGRYQDALIRWRGNNNSKSWRNTSFNGNNATDVECQADNGVDGNLQAASPYPRGNGYTSNSAPGIWTGTAAQSYWNSGVATQYTLYSGNYVTWYNQFRTQVLGTRMSIMQQAATEMLNSLTGVNVGLMRYSTTASGGMVAYPVSAIETNRANLISTVQGYTPNGFTPLSETLYESYLYYSGGGVRFGNTSSPHRSVASSRSPAVITGANYDSPADYSCQKNYVVYLTDGLPTQDDEANTAIQGLSNFPTLGGSCLAAGSGPDSSYPNSGLCLGALAQYMFNGDLRTGAGAPAGQQNARSFFIGLGDDFVTGNQLNAAFDYLQAAATRGGGQAYQAGDADQLSAVLSTITSLVKQESASFTSPTIAVNAFNRTRMLNQLYFSMFQPTSTYHWPGNVKKYKLVNGEIVDDNDLPAVDASTGQFRTSSRSIWSNATDGNVVTSGGAANEIPAGASRNVYTYMGSNPAAGSPVVLSGNGAYSVSPSNAALTDAVLGTTVSGDPTRDKLLNWARGLDVNDENGDGSVADSRSDMGDPIHSQPAVVIYGGTTGSPNLDDAVVFAATNDGYLHAFDTVNGTELWSFIPNELLGNLLNVYEDNSTAVKPYALDGDVVVLKFDVNADGIVDSSAGDQVVLIVGQGRGGSNYYALDVTSKTNPKFMWRIGAGELAGLGQAWATPVIARVQVGNGSSQASNQKFVLVISGGYDPAEDGNSTAGTYLSQDTVGHRLFMVDVKSGNLLWSGGPTGAGTTQEFGTRMTHSIPAAPLVADIDGDGYADRMYVGDMGGQVWRFDITSGNPASSLVAGGVLASLGAHDDSPALTSNARRFYSTPDVALVSKPGVNPYINIAIGSGYRGHPLNTTIQDRLYGLRDYNPFVKLTQAEYNALTVVYDNNLVDISGTPAPAVPYGQAGWKYPLNRNGGWIGEKSLASATTVGGTVFFTSYTPSTGAAANPCDPVTGTNRVYALSAFDGKPTLDLNDDGVVDQDLNDDGVADANDASKTIADGAITADVKVLFLDTGNGNCVGPNCTQQPVCLASKTSVPCPPIDQFTKTYWREGAAN